MFTRFMWLCVLSVFSGSVHAEAVHALDLASTQTGVAALVIFLVAYVLVMAEEFIHLRKSKPVILAAGLIWALIACYYQSQQMPHVVAEAFRHNLLEYAELMLFLIVAMTYINALNERQVFEALRTWLIRMGLSYRGLFWVTGLLAFLISPIADNLTTALLMGAVVLAVGGSHKQFVLLCCINLVVAANAGGAFSPFGDITTLMVWQKNIHASNGVVGFSSFFSLFLPALVNWLVPALCMHVALPRDKPKGSSVQLPMRRGALVILGLFLLTIALAVMAHSLLDLPPVLGMLSGLGLLQLFSYYLQMTGEKSGDLSNPVPYDIYNRVAQAEWDTLFFFYGVILCVGGLGFIGYLSLLSHTIYGDLGATTANIAVGLISSVVDNIPVMFAVLSMMPDMSVGQWLLVTLTAGVGGSLLSIGSAAGVALMGQAHGSYTFFGHLRWMPAIALGYVASILAHMWLNHGLF
ncbi:sodium:proton antiporter NhaD [Methylophilus aquaticus]|uniref:Sodium:proton antiporter NhaD n=1 Tax=Methylophilus aquaticus TaxID=1971610 RepID=A0ABT9JQN4_9PROT|nr:sodium:proton antiporter NhaD [Methylophilus aquaticus]MDP8566877.1 sodium:proton antiporter NhaD [Methylophilus aquaticus]